MPIRLGTTVTAVTQTADGVLVRFDDGTTRTCDVLVGADGIHSSIRRLLFGGLRSRAVGQTSWRFIADDTWRVATWTVMLARNRAFLMVPVGSGGLYCYADLMNHQRDEESVWEADGAQRLSTRDRLRMLFGDFGGPVPEILSRLDEVETIHAAPIEEVHLDDWVNGRVVLVGDAAHATSPNMAEGASMALEDALILAEELSWTIPPTSALEAFAQRRRARVGWVRQRTHRRDRIRALPVPLRNLALRSAGPAIYRADYGPLFAEP